MLSLESARPATDLEVFQVDYEFSVHWREGQPAYVVADPIIYISDEMFQKAAYGFNFHGVGIQLHHDGILKLHAIGQVWIYRITEYDYERHAYRAQWVD